MLITLVFDPLSTRIKLDKYSLETVNSILPKTNDLYAAKLADDTKGGFSYNDGYTASYDDVAGSVAGPKFSASFAPSTDGKVTVTDSQNQVSFSIIPKFSVGMPRKDVNRIIYPVDGKRASVVYTVRASSVKEDIILFSEQGDSVSFKYTLQLGDSLEPRIEPDGSIGVYGVEGALLGSVATGSDQDAQLLEKARKAAKKTRLMFSIPAPHVTETGKTQATASSRFELKDNELTIYTEGLKGAKYPLSIDPTVYIETARKLMRGNNETNVDFDTDNELIQKSQTTGARIDGWEGTLDTTQATWDQGMAAGNGYAYQVGGTIGTSKPSIVDTVVTTASVDTATFTMDMPTTRPAGDLYVALMCYEGSQGDGSGGSTAGNNISTPTGWTKYAGRQGHAAYYKVGTDQGGGSESASYAFTGDSENWAGVIMRVTGFDPADVVSGTDGEGHSTTNATPVFPATTPDKDSTLVIRAVGADNDVPSATAWVPSGHTKIESGNSGGANDCSFVAASLDTSPASGVSTGTATLADTSINDDYGASSIAINALPVTPAPQSSVYWAEFDTVTTDPTDPDYKSIVRPNPGTGQCSGWCNDSDYNLSEGRIGMSVVAYNGYLYAMGGSDGTNRESTVWIAKIGINGEPQLWHPTDTNKNNWVYWYADTGLNGATARSYFSAYAYNNRMYVTGGQTNASTGGTTTVEMADILPNGRLGTWTTTGMQVLPDARHMHSIQVYNDYMYLIGGNSSGTLRNTTYYSRLNSDGTMNAWVQTNSFTNARASFGGNMATIAGGYAYLAGGCTSLTGAYCGTVATDDVQLASINADGSLAEWNAIINLKDQRIGSSLITWQGGLYRFGGCSAQNTGTGACTTTLSDVDFGDINPDGEASTVATSVPAGSGTCSGTNPYNCDVPSQTGGFVGDVLTSAVVMNGYLYIMGGCNTDDCSGESAGVVYAAISSTGSLTKPSVCGGTYVTNSAFCVSSNSLPSARGAAATAVFNGKIYLTGGWPSINAVSYTTVNSDGSIGAWTSQTMSGGGTMGATSVSYSFTYTRANPSSASTYPGNFYIFGGCTSVTSVTCTTQTQNVYKCYIKPDGSIEITGSTCTTTGQLQIGTVNNVDPVTLVVTNGSGTGLGAHSGAVYANYIYLLGGLGGGLLDITTVRYGKFDDSNNVVHPDTGLSTGSFKEEQTNVMLVGRRRGSAFGYNGYLYVTGGYDGTDALADIEFAKISVSDGSWEAFDSSSVSINKRWGLTVAVSNSYAYVIGGCIAGAAPTGCTSRTDTIQTFQIYNNNSGTPVGYSASANQFGTDRFGSSSAIVNGYLYVAGGCTSTTDCTTAIDSVQYAAIDVYGNISSAWSAGGNLPAVRAWGTLETAGGTLYYIGGQTSTATDERPEVYYATPSGGAVTWSTVSSSFDLPDGRTQHSSAVWNDRIYVLGGIAETGGAVSNAVYVSPDLSAGGTIGSAWSTLTSFDVARSGSAAVAYANNLYILGGYDGTNYLSDVQFAQINSDGTVDPWVFSTSLPTAIRQGDAFASNGYMYMIGGRSANTTCTSNTLVAPISANTTIATGNNPTGVGEWFETNARYEGRRYGGSVAYSGGRYYLTGGVCDGFPTVKDRLTQTFAASATHNVTMPATVNSGDLLMVLITNDHTTAGTITTPSGWTSKASSTQNTQVRASVFVKVADGTEDGANVNFATSASEEAAAHVYRVQSGEWSGSTAGIEVSTASNATTASPNPASLDPGAWATENTLWVAYVGGSSYNSVTTYPSSFNGGVHNQSNTGTGGASSSSAWLESATSSVDPGTFAMNASNDGVAYTIAIRPAGFVTTGANRAVQTAVYSQPQVAVYSRMIDTDTDVFPTSWLMNGIDNSIGARWRVKYRSMHDLDTLVNPSEDCGTSSSMAQMTTWGQETNYGNVTLGDVAGYTAKESGGGNINCARYYYFSVSIDSSQTFGYPEDVSRGPTISDLSLFFTSDPNKRLRHGKTFTGGEQQPLDTPCRQTIDADCPLP